MILSGVISQAKAAGQPLVASMEAIDNAYKAGKVPASGKVTGRLVRSAFASLSRTPVQMNVDLIPNPFPSPHNLTWYFSQCICPPEVRAFVTMLGRKNIRVWSVGHTVEGWMVLAQVFGEDSGKEAVKTVELESKVASRRLQKHTLSSIEEYKLVPKAGFEDFMHEHAKLILKHQGLGNFVELSLERKA